MGLPQQHCIEFSWLDNSDKLVELAVYDALSWSQMLECAQCEGYNNYLNVVHQT